jgi:hypothetical protein
VTEDQHVAKNKGQFKQIKQFQSNIRILNKLLEIPVFRLRQMLHWVNELGLEHWLKRKHLAAPPKPATSPKAAPVPVLLPEAKRLRTAVLQCLICRRRNYESGWLRVKVHISDHLLNLHF